MDAPRVKAQPTASTGGLSTTDALRRSGYLGIASGVTFVLTTAAGSVLDPTYSQIRQHVSDLTATGASTYTALAPFYLLYNVLTAAFAIELYRGSVRTRLWRVGAVLIVLNAVSGVLMTTLFREDMGGVPVTTAGGVHIALAGVSSLLIIASSFVYAVAFRRHQAWRPVAWFSFAIGVGFAILGPLAAYATAAGSDLAGLAERGPLGLFVAWVVVVGGFAVRLGRRGRAGIAASKPRPIGIESGG